MELVDIYILAVYIHLQFM